MRKLLFLALIAIALSTVIEQTATEDVALDAVDWRGLWDKVKNTVAKAKQWLKDNNLYQPLVNAITKSGQGAAKKLCESHGIPGSVCSEIISWILRHVLNQ